MIRGEVIDGSRQAHFRVGGGIKEEGTKMVLTYEHLSHLAF